MKTTIDDIITYVSDLAGHPLNRDEGVHHGPVGRAVTGATVCWMASPDAIRAAGEHGHELLVCHESLYFPYDVINSPNPPPGWEAWQVNRQRRELLERARPDGASPARVARRDLHLRRLRRPPGVGRARLRRYARQGVRDRALPIGRVGRAGQGPDGDARGARQRSAGMDQIVHRVGLPWGGMGLFVNVGYQQRLIEQSCDVFIAGESDNYGFRFAAECGIPMIETSHELSENDGLRRFTDMLAQAFPDVCCRFFENTCAWTMR